MPVHLKPIEEQVIVITGATSGIGLVTARMAAAQGAHVVLAARDRDALAQVAEEIRHDGGTAVHCVADVADEEAMRRVADTAIRAFGGFDTWVNNAGVSIYGRIEEISMEDHRRLFETNYWGTVIGSLVALRHLRQHGGALINVGSVVSERAIPLQGPYSATKHAVKGFTDALRMEVETDGAPVSVSLIKPATIDTQFEEHGKNTMDSEPVNPPPVYAPELVAQAILHAAQTPVRDLIVGGSGKLFQWGERYMPRLTDRVMERFVTRYQRSGGPRQEHGDSLWHPSGHDHEERAGRHSFVRETSVYTQAQMHPWVTTAVFAGLGALAVAAYAGKLPTGRRRQPMRLLEDKRARRGYTRRSDVEEFGHNAKPAEQAAAEGTVTFAR
ncbi:SDR family oxidoreductase [Azospirillum sp.]|uniref:SDR family oxidoreductase n=1 Tax=Azospirillum sp. TaxID=34012 RepID=UPI002D40E6C6|nr:SDR family oxidoreductase [Azospirillum sp.]HYD68873.1 SDR family oxidoreductase [Azospirillum sp.]